GTERLEGRGTFYSGSTGGGAICESTCPWKKPIWFCTSRSSWFTSLTQFCMAISWFVILVAEIATSWSSVARMLVVSYVLPASRQAKDVTIMIATKKTTTRRKKIVNCLVLIIWHLSGYELVRKDPAPGGDPVPGGP